MLNHLNIKLSKPIFGLLCFTLAILYMTSIIKTGQENLLSLVSFHLLLYVSYFFA